MPTVEQIVPGLGPWHRALYDFFAGTSYRDKVISPSSAASSDTYQLAETGGSFDNFIYASYPNSPYMHESARVIKKDGWLAQYDFVIDDVLAFHIYPMRGGRAFVYKEEYFLPDLERKVSGEVLSDWALTQMIRQIVVWRAMFARYPFKVDDQAQTIELGSAMVEVFATRPLSSGILTAIGLGLAHNNVEAAIKADQEHETLNLFVGNDKEIDSLCRPRDRCPSSDPDPGRMAFYAHRYLMMGARVDQSMQYANALELSGYIHHETWHMIGDKFIKGAGNPHVDAYKDYFPLMTGFFTAIGFSKDEAVEMASAECDENTAQKIFSYFGRAFDVAVWVGIDSFDVLGYFMGDIYFPSEWYARMGVCTTWEEDCRGELDRIFPPMGTYFDIHEATQDPQAMKEYLASWGEQAGKSGRPVPKMKITYFVKRDEPDAYLFGPFTVVDEGECCKGFLDAGDKVLLGADVIDQDDPRFAEMFMSYDIEPSWHGVDLRTAEALYNFMQDNGGADWRLKEKAYETGAIAQELMGAVNYACSNAYRNHTANILNALKFAREFAKTSGAEKEKAMNNVAHHLANYISWSSSVELDIMARQEMSHALPELLAIIGRDSWPVLKARLDKAIEGKFKSLKEEYHSGLEYKVKWFNMAWSLTTRHGANRLKSLTYSLLTYWHL